eukprot:TRINITY_DN329_c0_g1_i1.p1 TRINITY_DN329_c0_g1~~TRINITY_DN329_c0_g1_i1.p1  ORF type:complete len:185 (-),score=78.55 TRINITY_DN329_c0_g1_i1:100-594(-)
MADLLDDFLAPSSAAVGGTQITPPTSTGSTGSPAPVSKGPYDLSEFGSSLNQSDDSPLRKYEIEQAKLLEEKRAATEKKRQELLEAAKQSVTTFYEERTDAKKKAETQNIQSQKAFEAERDEILAGGNSSNQWDHIVSLVDLQAGKTEGKDVSRMRQVLLKLKH